jgi:hypothetical protein
MNPDWLRAVRRRLSTGAQNDHSFELGMVEAALGLTGPARRRLKWVDDRGDRADLAVAIAKALVATDRSREAFALASSFEATDELHEDRLYEAIAGGMLARNNIRGAVATARLIKGPIRRVRAFRRLAIVQARRLDQDEALEGRVPAERGDEEKISVASPVVRRANYSLYSLQDQSLGTSIPRLPDPSRFKARDVMAAIPAVSDGQVSVVPLTSNSVNKKFLTKRTKSSDDQIGGPTIVMEAQASRYPLYIHVSSGVLDLPTLRASLIRQGHSNLLTREGRDYTLRVPLFVGTGATLVLTSADVGTLRLSTQRAAFLVNAGTIHMYGVEIVGWDEQAGAPAYATEKDSGAFRPFYTAWSNSRTYATETRFLSLGYSAGKAYGFSLSSGPISLNSFVREVVAPTGIIVDNSFENLLYGFYSYEARNVVVVGNEYRDNVVYGVDPHDRSHNLLFGYNTSYGAHKKHGIIGSRNVEDSWFLGNLSFGNHGSGLMMDRYTGRNIIYANTAFDNQGDGLTIYESPCNILATNLIFSNGRSGIKVRNSWDVGIYRNAVIGNGGLGVEGYPVEFKSETGAPTRDLLTDPYERSLSVALIGNSIRSNKAGAISMASLGTIALRGNHLAGKSERLFLGDLQSVEQDVARAGPPGLIVAGGCPRPRNPYQCPFVEAGYLSAEVARVPGAMTTPATCPKPTIVNEVTKAAVYASAAKPASSARGPIR